MRQSLHTAETEQDAPTSETADVASAGRIEEQGTTVDCDSAACIAVEQADKAFGTLRATLALHGFELHIFADGARGIAYVVQRWNLDKLLPDQAAVRAFAEQVGADG